MKKVEAPNYGINIDDEVQEMNLGGLFDEPVLPQQNKQIVPKPPTYEESLQDVLEGKKQIYMNPDNIQPGDGELLPEYGDDDEIDCASDDEDTINTKLDDISIANYESVEKQLNDPVMTPKRTKKYPDKILLEAIIKRNQLKGYKAHVTKQFKSGKISEAEKQMQNQRINDANAVLNQYIKHCQNKVRLIRRKQRGGNVVFLMM